MAILALILGESGTGKTASLRNLDTSKYALVNVEKKPLPFKAKGTVDEVRTDDYADIKAFVNSTDRDIIIIDDAQYTMANEFMRRADEKGFDKFTAIGKNFWNLIKTCENLPPQKRVYFLQHIEETETGKVKAKTIGKLIDEKICLEGMFSIVLRTAVVDGKYGFRTKNNGNDTVKSPIGLFERGLIENDLFFVDNAICSYYGITSHPNAGNTETVNTPTDAEKAPKQAKNTLKNNSKIVDSSAPKLTDREVNVDGTAILTKEDKERIKCFPKELQEQMIAKGVTPDALEAFVNRHPFFSDKTLKIEQYPKKFIEQVIIGSWDKVVTDIIQATLPF